MKDPEAMEREVTEILWQIKGNDDLGIEGLRPQLKRIESDVKDLKHWRSMELDRKDNRKRIFQAFGVAIASVLTIISIFAGIKQVLS